MLVPKGAGGGAEPVLPPCAGMHTGAERVPPHYATAYIWAGKLPLRLVQLRTAEGNLFLCPVLVCTGIGNPSLSLLVLHTGEGNLLILLVLLRTEAGNPSLQPVLVRTGRGTCPSALCFYAQGR